MMSASLVLHLTLLSQDLSMYLELTHLTILAGQKPLGLSSLHSSTRIIGTCHDDA